MKGGEVMNQQGLYDKFEEARRLKDEEMALINESMKMMETERELSQKMFDEGTELWKKGCKMQSEAVDQIKRSEIQAREKQHPPHCSCKQCQIDKPICITENLPKVLELLKRKKEN